MNTTEQNLHISQFDYNLPEALIAQLPSDRRETSRMLVMKRQNKVVEHKRFFNIVDYLSENDLLVMNNTRVIPARLFGQKDTGAKIEIFLLDEKHPNTWHCLIKPSKRIKPGMIIKISEELSVKAIEKLDEKWIVELIYEGSLYEILDKIGNLPLPPYIQRKIENNEFKDFDYERYQTVYAKKPGSVAAPTAGLHFTPEIIEQLKQKGVQTCDVTLNVGLGTFRPVKCDNILEHKMHKEIFELSEKTAEIINQAKLSGKNIVAVGTTTVRTLETIYQKLGKIAPCNDYSELFIYPGYKFGIVNKMITNFHLPKSTLLMLVSAFAGHDFVFDAYNQAIENQYRFFSYGDCMFIE